MTMRSRIRSRSRAQGIDLPYRQLRGRRLVVWGHPTIVAVLGRHAAQTITTDQAVDLINRATQAGVQRWTVQQRSQELHRASRDSPRDAPEGLEQQQPPEAPAFDPIGSHITAERQAAYDIFQSSAESVWHSQLTSRILRGLLTAMEDLRELLVELREDQLLQRRRLQQERRLIQLLGRPRTEGDGRQ
ncbi:hypothetical protein L596_001891 [Steinernema carpocapsae]|uniref:Uncharacterized protein n=1 Tax=Steinernema carpocapsae TaxID=34508 RepID=A0A4V6I7I7_STECR|nr:hypothetical protein L596_001891 [Steinernema carpocapsae]